MDSVHKYIDLFSKIVQMQRNGRQILYLENKTLIRLFLISTVLSLSTILFIDWHSILVNNFKKVEKTSSILIGYCILFWMCSSIFRDSCPVYNQSSESD